MIYLIIYLIGCIIAYYTFIELWTKDDDITIMEVPFVIIFTIESWITLFCIGLYWLLKIVISHIDLNKVLIKHKKK